eukprot:4789730-Pleurochrysis_carterae.AAC.1
MGRPRLLISPRSVTCFETSPESLRNCDTHAHELSRGGSGGSVGSRERRRRSERVDRACRRRG